MELGETVVCYAEGQIVGVELDVNGEKQFKVRYGVYGQPGYGVAFLHPSLVERANIVAPQGQEVKESLS